MTDQRRRTFLKQAGIASVGAVALASGTATTDGVEGVAPFTWAAFHDDERDFAFVTDSDTGVYTFDVSGKTARGEDGGGPGHYYDVEAVIGRD
ncbi:hypothetical protein [Salinilacihabitans rarus]|uniref:hypothetical protein n=1 Tax=Salinilacihabitans rarus TaxID=2961596 RepID=UPI0020C8E8A2|nr:hypothetical protein [Salinilacihabitans rarus]